ncbi:MAG TPA: hypothetical protein VG755_30515 [Nannocystaceae bacterium]|nr:hypothetical protein [Nannocystaceae bacterium]
MGPSMLRPPFPGHRRYSITHRAVQRLRELVPKRDDEDDETLRDRLDAALASAEADGKAIRTLDAMLGEPQTLIPIADFGDVLYAIIKEETVVTVLPQGHGEEILQRGQAMEQRVAAGHVAPRPGDRLGDRLGDRPVAPASDDDRWDRARRWRSREIPTAPVVIEKTPLSRPGNGVPAAPADDAPSAPAVPRPDAPRLADLAVSAKVVPLPERPKLEGPVGEALRDALEKGKRKAAVAALREVLSTSHRDASLLPLWNELAKHEIPQTLTVGDLLEALRGL